MDPSDPIYNQTCGLARLANRVDALVPMAYMDFTEILLGVLCFYYVSTLCVFRYYQPRFLWLRKRSFTMILFFDLGCVNYLVVSPIRDIIGYASFPCDADMWLRNTGTYLLLGVMTLRFIFFRKLVNLNTVRVPLKNF